MQFVNGEIVKIIPGFKSYLISESGRIYRIKMFSKKRKTKILFDNSNIKVFSEVKKQFQDRDCFKTYTIALYNDKKKLTTRSVPRLLIEAFGSELKANFQSYKLIYLDGNPRNCHIDNLEIKVRDLKQKKIEPEIIPVIKKMLDEGIPVAKISLMYGLNINQINMLQWKRL